ncbi:MAG TPA: GNAT family N-acetyltransferase [Caulobacteraceae bacterium]|nr:GNAT family N-acetyltransferase [Caulobacteraceae bacterium]
MSEDSGLALLAVDLDVLFVTSPSGRIVRVNSPDGEAGPRLVLAGCCSGNLLRLRGDVGDAAARDIAALVADEPPWRDAAEAPPCLPGLIRLLSREARVTHVSRGIPYVLPNGLHWETPATTIAGDEAEGRDLLGRLAREGASTALAEAGFRSVADFWAPWCAALQGGEIAAIAFAARLGPRAAEVGVYTLSGFRGRGLAAAVTARWSSLAALAGRRLFYSTQITNRASQRVAGRLGLRTLGATLAVT